MKLLTPLIVSKHSSSNVLECEAPYINGSTIRGAILSKVYRDSKDAVKAEIENPQLIFHPLFPSTDGVVYKPAHTFVYRCKVCGSTKDYLPELINDNLEFRRIPPKMCEQMHLGAMKSLQGELVDETLQPFKPRFTVQDSVGMSKIFRSSEPTMVYTYVCLAPESTFTGIIVDRSSTRLNGLKLGNEFKAHLGRGASRGLGYAKIVLEETPNHVEYVADKIETAVRKTKPYVVVKALTPTSVNRWMHALENTPNLSLERSFVAGTTQLSGFSLLTNTPKASVKCVKAGSLSFYKYSGSDYTPLITKLTEPSIVGLEPFNILGLDILEVVS